MDKEKVLGYVNQAKEFVLKYKFAVIGAVAAVVVAIGGWTWYQAQPKSVTSVVEVSFSGYDGYGVLEYNYEDLSEEIARVSYLKAGFSKDQAEDLIKGDSVILAEVDADPDLSGKYSRALAMIGSVSYEFDKTTDLSNGDTIVLKIKTTSSKSPVKKETKKFTVKGLDKVEKISTKEFLEEYPVEFVGFDGYGSLELPEDEDGYSILSYADGSEPSKLKNGDTVELEVSSTFLYELQEEGKKLESDTIEVEVSGLKSITEISNLSEALSKNDTYIKSNYENTSSTTYTLEKQKSYIAYKTGGYYDSSSGQIYLVSVYKVTTASKYSDTTVEYVYYGYRYYINSDNSLDLETANKVSGYETQDLENLIADLETEGYAEYTAKSE